MVNNAYVHRYGVFLWERLPKGLVKGNHGIEGLRKWLKDGGRTGGEDDDAQFIFFNGDEQLGGGPDCDGSDGFYLFTNSDGTVGLILWVLIAEWENARKINPEISVSEEDGWEMPDKCWTVPVLEHEIKKATVKLLVPQVSPSSNKFWRDFDKIVSEGYYVLEVESRTLGVCVDHVQPPAVSLDDIHESQAVTVRDFKTQLPDFSKVSKYMREKYLGNTGSLRDLNMKCPHRFDLSLTEVFRKKGLLCEMARVVSGGAITTKRRKS